jgi:hypothetical protein
METVDILLRRDRIDDAREIDGSGSCTRMPCTVGSSLSVSMRASTACGSAPASNRIRLERTPASVQARILART